MAKRILVYGTLRKGGALHRSLDTRHARLVNEVRLPGYDMYQLGWYPGIRPNPENKEGIVGEVYEVPDQLADETMSHLDAVEGYSPDNEEHSLYLRREVLVDGQPTSLYVYNQRVRDDDQLIVSGDWNNREK